MDQSGRLPASTGDVTSNAPTTANTLFELVIAAGNLKTFAAAARVANLADTLNSQGRFTVFVPTDEAVTKLSPGAFEALLKDPARLKAVLNYHIVSGHLLTEDLKSGEMATLQGRPLTVTAAGADIRVNDARVVQANRVAKNGVVHAIDAVILPKQWRLVAEAA
jgi:uncharacterized surface protein with fasciclin (FAS1) repeats